MTETELEPRPASHSATEMTELLLPQHANALGTAFGGTIMSWVDICAAITAQRHCGRVAVTAFVDDLEFFAPIRIGDVVRLTARVNATFRTSLEVEVLVEREAADTMERTVCADALLTFVAVDDEGRPCPVPALRADTEQEQERAREAAARRKHRLAVKHGR